METYKQVQDFSTKEIVSVERLSDHAFIPFDPANTDYQNFKAQILASEAELEDVDGVIMAPEQAIAYVQTLP